MKLRKQIKRRRKDMGLTQYQVAARVGVVRSAYANWENGHRAIRGRRLRQIERVLHAHFG
jgi:transcriptional regulator with XRE-family HTH domain